MAVIITNMDMPRGCYECPLREDHGWEGDWCAVSEGCDLIGETTRPDYCPLIEAAQEPILNKIRAEIEEYRDSMRWNSESLVKWEAINYVLKHIIDKYKTENEVDNGNDDL